MLELVSGCKHAVIPHAVDAARRNQRGEPAAERGAVGDPAGAAAGIGLAKGELDAPVGAQRDSFCSDRGSQDVTQQALEGAAVARWNEGGRVERETVDDGAQPGGVLVERALRGGSTARAEAGRHRPGRARAHRVARRRLGSRRGRQIGGVRPARSIAGWKWPGRITRCALERVMRSMARRHDARKCAVDASDLSERARGVGDDIVRAADIVYRAGRPSDAMAMRLASAGDGRSQRAGSPAARRPGRAPCDRRCRSPKPGMANAAGVVFTSSRALGRSLRTRR